MCLTCNPYCGRCHPPRARRAVRCLDCGLVNTFDDGDLYRKECSFCGGRLPEFRATRTLRCTYTGLLCSAPCDKSGLKPPGGVKQSCDMRVPPIDAKAFAKTMPHGPSEVAQARDALAKANQAAQASAAAEEADKRRTVCAYTGLPCTRRCGRFSTPFHGSGSGTCDLRTPPES